MDESEINFDDVDNNSAGGSVVETYSIGEVIDELKTYGMKGEHYKIEQQIGQGGMATIYKAYHIGLKHSTVLKVILPEIMDDHDMVTRFVEEARITSQLQHGNIVPVNDIGILSNERIFYSMYLVEGEELEAILKQLVSGDVAYEKKYNIHSLLTIFRKVCDACAFAHSKKILHRDIKPDNIMIGNFGDVYLMDWGLAAREESIGEDVEMDDDLSQSTAVIKLLDERDQYIRATPAYMSPEQAYGKTSTLDRRTDIFLLGATLYAIATLCEPYTGDTLAEAMSYARTCNFIPPNERAPERNIPDDLCSIIMRAMQENPEDRYQTVEEMCVDIDAFINGNAISIKKSFRSGTFLIREGDVGNEAYVITEGKVEVNKMIDDIKVNLRTLGPGDCVGELAVISPAPRSATVMALGDVEVIVINENIIKQGIEKLPSWMTKIIQSLVEHLREATGNVHYLISKDCSYHVIAQVRLLYPAMGRLARDEKINDVLIVVETGRLIREITLNLSIPEDRITAVITTLFECGLLRPYRESEFFIPNFQTFYKFTDFTAKRLGIQSAITNERAPFLFASNIETTLSLMDSDKIDEQSDLETVYSEQLTDAKIDSTQFFDSLYNAVIR